MTALIITALVVLIAVLVVETCIIIGATIEWMDDGDGTIRDLLLVIAATHAELAWRVSPTRNAAGVGRVLLGALVSAFRIIVVLVLVLAPIFGILLASIAIYGLAP